MKKHRRDFLCILFVSVVIAVFTAIPVLNAATISGTVFKEDGSTPVNDATVAVNLYSGTPCGVTQLMYQDTTTSGSYMISGISPGIYYLKTVKVSGAPNYINEWWASAGSVWDCWGGEAIIVNSTEEVISNKNFQLDLYGSISGSLYDAAGVLITTNQIIDVIAFRGNSCENSEFIGAQVKALSGNYNISVPPGTYYVKSSNKGSVWYIDEFHTVSGNTNNGVSYQCDSAVQVTVDSGTNTPNIDLQLDIGGRISGTVFKSDGITPIIDADIRIFAYDGDACNRQFVDGTMTSNGDYIIAGIPAGTYYLQSFRESGANYTTEWYSEPLSSYDCNDAFPVQVFVMNETTNKNFQLDSGGSISGTLVDENGAPVGNLKVECDTQVPSGWQDTWSDPVDGTFALYGLDVGHAEITIISDPARYLAGFRRNYYLTPGENKDIGTLKVKKGAAVSGTVVKDGTPLQDFELFVGAKLIMAEMDTAPDGTFGLVLPPGEFTVNEQEDFFAFVPQKVVVTPSDVMTDRILPTLSAYDTSNGDVYSGTVTVSDTPPTGSAVLMLSFMNDTEFEINNWSGVQPLNFGGFFTGTTTVNPYQLSTPPGSTVQLLIGVYGEWSDENESFTLVDLVPDVSGGGTYDFTYNSTGSTVDGYVTRNGQPVFWAMVGLYREADNQFVGFGRTDHNGYYILYNVPDGTYRLDATAEDYACVDSTPAFLVNGNLTVPDIELGEFKGDFEPDGDVDGLDLEVFSDAYAVGDPAADLDSSGVVDTGDLAIFAAEFGGVGCAVTP